MATIGAAEIRALAARVAALETTAISTASNLATLNAGSRGWHLSVSGALTPVSVPSGQLVHYPFPGLTLDDPNPPDGQWALVGGVVVGSNDLAARYTGAVTIDYTDSSLVNTNWLITFARGQNLASGSPVFTSDRVSVPGRTNVAGVGEPDGRAMAISMRHPDSGPETEYGLFVSHDRPTSVDFEPQALHVVYRSTNP